MLSVSSCLGKKIGVGSDMVKNWVKKKVMVHDHNRQALVTEFMDKYLLDARMFYSIKSINCQTSMHYQTNMQCVRLFQHSASTVLNEIVHDVVSTFRCIRPHKHNQSQQRALGHVHIQEKKCEIRGGWKMELWQI